MTFDIKQTGEITTLRVDHPDGGCTVIAQAPEYSAVISLDAPTLKRLRDRRRSLASTRRAP